MASTGNEKTQPNPKPTEIQFHCSINHGELAVGLVLFFLLYLSRKRSASPSSQGLLSRHWSLLFPISMRHTAMSSEGIKLVWPKKFLLMELL